MDMIDWELEVQENLNILLSQMVWEQSRKSKNLWKK